jgi:hypothetical protein
MTRRRDPKELAATTEEILPTRRGSRNPWVLVGAGATAAVLAGGFVAFKAGNAKASQAMMRARVLTQGATVALMVATSGVGVLSSFTGGGGEARGAKQ